MTTEKKSLGQAIDEIIATLSSLDEKARPTAIAAACAHLGLDRQSGSANTSSSVQSQAQPVGSVGVPRIQDIRTLKEQKRPENAQEMACLVAFYLQQHAPTGEQREVVTPGDMVKYFKQAHFPLPKAVGQLLVDAKHAGYFDLVQRGHYRLNAVGYNLVAHALPRTAEAGR